MWKYGAKVRCFIEMRNISNRAGGVRYFFSSLDIAMQSRGLIL